MYSGDPKSDLKDSAVGPILETSGKNLSQVEKQVSE